MPSFKPLASLAFALAIFASPPSPAATVCKPKLSVKQARLSDREDAPNSQRKWTAIIDVDASRCATSSGRFTIHIVREKENAPELEFSEQSTWQTGPTQVGQIEIAVDFWRDEAVLAYFVGPVGRCPCRN
jgi:hypothetical protein